MYVKSPFPTARLRVAPVFDDHEAELIARFLRASFVRSTSTSSAAAAAAAADDDDDADDDADARDASKVSIDTYDARARACVLAFASTTVGERAHALLRESSRADVGLGDDARARDASFRVGYSASRRRAREDAHPSATSASRASASLAIPGLTLVENFVSDDEEKELAALVASGRSERLAKREVTHFGYEFSYATRDANEKCEEIPERAKDVVLRRLTTEFTWVSGADAGARCDQATANAYRRGVGLAPHVDTHSAFESTILSLSLLSGTVMEFRREGYENRALYLPPRSLLVLHGEARYAWQHYIPHRKNDNVEGVLVPRGDLRLSYTFRERRTGACECAWPEACDSRSGKASLVSKRAVGATQKFAHLVGE